jgi:LacI family transcriptional regulator
MWGCFGAYLEMVRFLIDLGHRRIGFIAGDPIQSASAQRLEGYRDGLAEANIEFQQCLIAQGMFTYQSGMVAAEQLLSQSRPPTAILASNDDMAAAAVGAAHRRGLDVPHDITVCGFDDNELATAIWPELTTVRQPTSQMAEIALEILVQEIKKRGSHSRQKTTHHVMGHAIIHRQSHCRPKAT